MATIKIDKRAPAKSPRALEQGLSRTEICAVGPGICRELTATEPAVATATAVLRKTLSSDVWS